MRSWTENRLLMTLLFAGFAAVSGLLILFGDTGEKVFGVAALVMFGGGGAAWWIGEFASARAAKPTLGAVTLPSGLSSRALILPMRAGKQRAAVVAQAAVGVGSLILALYPGSVDRRPPPILLLPIGIFLLLNVLRGVRRWAHSDLYIALAPSGVLVRGLPVTTFIPWNGIKSVSSFRLHGQRYLGIDARGPNVIESRGPFRSIDRLERPLIGRDRSLWLGGLAIRHETAEQLICDYYDHPEKRLRLGSEPVPDDLLREAERALPAITEEEKRQASSIGRWVGAFVLVVFGIYICAIPVGVAFRVAEGRLNRVPTEATSGDATIGLLAMALLALVLIAGLAHFGAAAAIVMRREFGRRLGIALSAAGLALGATAVVGIALTGSGHDVTAWVLGLIVLGGYSLSMVILFLVGNLSLLRSPPKREAKHAPEGT